MRCISLEEIKFFEEKDLKLCRLKVKMKWTDADVNISHIAELYLKKLR